MARRPSLSSSIFRTVVTSQPWIRLTGGYARTHHDALAAHVFVARWSPVSPETSGSGDRLFISSDLELRRLVLTELDVTPLGGH